MTTKSRRGSQVVKEHYDLQWDGWEQFRYRVEKGQFMVMDVTVWKGRAYQRELGGRIRIREDPGEMHYYLRQTWNQWNGATEAFKPVLTYEFVEMGDVEGRPVEKYNISMTPRIEPNPSSAHRLRQSIEHDSAEGTVWIDRETGVPLHIDFRGEYRTVRFSRSPTGPREEALHRVEFELRRFNLGHQQVTESPAVARSP